MASIIRATVFFGTAAFGDRTWASVDLVGWSIIETSVYIITGCLPHTKPLISHYTPAWLKRAIKSSIGSLPTKLTSLKSRSGSKSYGYAQSKSRSTRRDAKSQTPDDDSVELTSSSSSSQGHTLKGATSVSSMSNHSMGMHSPDPRIWPHNQADVENMSPRVNIRSSSLEFDKQDSPPPQSGHITVTREITMTRE